MGGLKFSTPPLKGLKNLDAKIDYISATVMKNLNGVGHSEQVYDAILYALTQESGGALYDLLSRASYEPSQGRGHYGTSLHSPDTKAVIFWGGSSNHILIELTGTTCQWMRDNSNLDHVIQNMDDRFTRLDIAVDFVTDVPPKEFALAVTNQRWKITREFNEKSGATCYVGSTKSDRFARVYKFNPPHPRAGVLRCEMVLRGNYAKQTARSISQHGLKEVVKMLGNSFSWNHPLWKPESTTTGKLRASRADRNDPNTLIWLQGTVKSALINAHKSGLINIHDFMDDILAELDNTDRS